MISSGFRFIATFARRVGGAIRGDPVSKQRVLSLVTTVVLFGLIPNIVPDPFNEFAHDFVP